MFNANIARLISGSKLVLRRYSPEILTGIGIAGMVTTTILAVKATPKALKLIEIEEEEKHMRLIDDSDDSSIVESCKLKPLEIVKVAWKPYIPAMVTGVASIACLVGASSVNVTRNAALATAYKLTETAFSDYKEKVVETIGEEKEKVVREKVEQSILEKNPVSNNTVIITNKGNTLCHDVITGRYFESDIELIKRALGIINRKMLNNEYVSLNEFYNEIGLDTVPLGEELGWRVDHGWIDPEFGSHIADDGRPCIVLGFSVAPVRDYYKFA